MEESPFGHVKSLIAQSVAAVMRGISVEEAMGSIERSRGIGDISCSIAFKLSKEQKRSPKEIADEIASRIKKPEYVNKITVDNSYLNFYLDKAAFSSFTIRFADNISDEPLSDVGKKEKVIIEYPSVNPNKPWHVGHLRNALLGDTIANLYDTCGYNVEREDYIDDLGLQVTESLWGYMNLGDKPPENAKFDTWLGAEYVKVNVKMKEKEDEMKQKITELMHLVEQSGTFEAKLAREISEACVLAQYTTAFNYGIYHDVLIWESDIVANQLLKKALQRLKEHKLIQEPIDGAYKGCVVLSLAEIESLPKELQNLRESVKVIMRSDGTPTYVAKDIAFHMWKFGLLEDTFKYSTLIEKQPNEKPVYSTAKHGMSKDFGKVKRVINVVDVQQSFEQSLLKLSFALLRENEMASNLIHLPYGRVELEGESLSGRKGTWEGYTADLLLEETAAKAAQLIGTRFRLSEEEKKTIANSVALSAIRFEFLKFSPEKMIIFSWNKALNFEGNSGPYCQYMYARAARLIADSGVPDISHLKVDYGVLVDDKEFELVKTISMFRDIVEKACAEIRPNVLAEYIIELALTFSRFYESSPILKGTKENEKLARLALVAAFAITMKKALSLMGIRTVDRM